MAVVIVFILLVTHLSASDDVTVTVRSQLTRDTWDIACLTGTDTVSHVATQRLPAQFRLHKGPTYQFFVTSADNSIFHVYFIATAGACPSKLVLTFDETSISVNNKNISRYHTILQQFPDTEVDYLDERPDQVLDSSIASVERFRSSIIGSITDKGLRDHALTLLSNELAPYLQVSRLRALALATILADTVDTDITSLRVSAAMAHFPEPPWSTENTEPHLLGARIRTYFVFSIINSLQRHHALTSNVRAVWARDPGIVVSVAGRSQACLVQMAFLTEVREGSPGFTSGHDSTLLNIAFLASDVRDPICRMNIGLIANLLTALNLVKVDPFNSIDLSDAPRTVHLNDDTVYVLHFWGTWCQGCMETVDSVNAIAKALDSIGVRTIHIAWQPRSSLGTLREVVGEDSLYQFMDPYVQQSDGIVKRMNIHLFPTYIVVGRNRKILSRFNDHKLILPNVTSALQKHIH